MRGHIFRLFRYSASGYGATAACGSLRVPPQRFDAPLQATRRPWFDTLRYSPTMVRYDTLLINPRRYGLEGIQRLCLAVACSVAVYLRGALLRLV